MLCLSAFGLQLLQVLAYLIRCQMSFLSISSHSLTTASLSSRKFVRTGSQDWYWSSYNVPDMLVRIYFIQVRLNESSHVRTIIITQHEIGTSYWGKMYDMLFKDVRSVPTKSVGTILPTRLVLNLLVKSICLSTPILQFWCSRIKRIRPTRSFLVNCVPPATVYGY